MVLQLRLLFRRGSLGTSRGNIFAMLFAAVALTGVLASVGMQTLTGPVTTITRVTQRNIADNNLLMNAKILVAAAVSGVSGGDPDQDGLIEPAAFVAASGGEQAPTSGGFLPASLGLALTDPWGTRYGYCVWDHGSTNSSIRRITGDSTANAPTQPVLAVVAAGPDKMFQTSCPAYAGNTIIVAKAGGSDDIVFRYTYAEATASSNGLWSLSPTDQTKAELKDTSGVPNVIIDRATGLGRFYGLVTDTLAAAADVITVDGGLKLDTQTNVATCGARASGVVRFNTVTSKLEVCNGAVWKPAGSSEATYITRTPSADLDSEQALSLLPSGVMKVATGTGTVSSGAVDLSGAEATGLLAAARFPALTGEVTTVAGSLTTAVADDVLDFSELKDAMTLDASTDIVAAGTNALSITNTGTAPSLRVNDDAADTTPFVIDAAGNVGVGTATPGAHLDVAGYVQATAYFIGGFNAVSRTSGSLTINNTADARGVLIYPGSVPAPAAIAVQNGTGHVGIGTTTPAARLDVAGGIKVGADAVCNTAKAGLVAWNAGVLLICDGVMFTALNAVRKLDDIGDVYLSEGGASEPGNNEILAWNASTDRWEAKNIATVGSAVATPGGSDKQVQFNDGGALAGAAQLYWDRTANRLGIGAPSSGASLSVASNGGPGAGFGAVQIRGDSNTERFEVYSSVSPVFQGLRARGTVAAPMPVQAGDLLVAVSGRGYDGTSWPTGSSALIRLVAAETFTSMARGANIQFQTVNTGTTTVSTKLIILADGNVGVGASAPVARLDVAGGARVGADIVCTSSKAGMLAWNSNTLQLCTETGTFTSLATASGLSGLTPALSSLRAATTTNTIDSTAYEQTWNWSTATTQSAMTLTADALTTGSLLSLTSASPSLASTNGVLYVANTGAGISGTVARIASNATAGSGLTVLANGNVGIGTTTPTNTLSIGGNAARSIWMERSTAAAAPGNNLTLQAGGTNFGNTDQNGGDLILSSGTATGTGVSSIRFQTAMAQSASSATDNAPTTKMTILGNGNVGIGTTAPASTLTVQKDQPYSPTLGMASMTQLHLRNDHATGGAALSIWGNGAERVRLQANPQFGASPPSIVLLAVSDIPMYIGTNSSIRMTIGAGSGYVGIGTVVPAAKLDVAGEVKLASTGLACAAATEGTQRYNSTSKTIEFCNGSVWTTFFSQAVQPNAFSFTDVTGASLGATVSSNAVTLGGFPGSLTATCSGCTAIARNGAWGGTIVSGFVQGDTIAIRVAASAAYGTAVTASASVGATMSGTWTVSTVSNSGPSAFGFTAVPSAATATTYTSDTVTLTGFTGTLTATCNTCTGIARNGVWGISPFPGFVAGDTIAIRQTSNATGGMTTTAAVTLGSTTSATWSVTTASLCAAGITVGQACPDGSIFAGFSPDGTVPMYTTPCDAGQTLSAGSCTGTRSTLKWNNGTSTWTTTGFTSAVTGRANTAGLVALADAGSPYAAAVYCDDLVAHGKSDWYLPAVNELNVLYINRTALGGFDVAAGQYYWTVTEVEWANSHATIQRFSDGAQAYYFKSTAFYARCIRR